ncbi:MAG: DUF4920 domain-containing protein [Flavobacteriaceae bacterium]|nr:DUF4920 domain-containing protein [Muriicola sp.]NNK21191.1 DUF4920 domain-containing protein [Flavobacteriaceae bacterium]NNL40751.1 DUF4920 domain-containing protein [Flavobacteriaceae bacterium]
MKGFNIILVILLLLGSCKEKNSQAETPVKEVEKEVATVFGSAFEADEVKSATDMADAITGLQQTDSLDVTFSGEVTEVCQMKGCWMKVALGDGEEMRVTFKDYGFFVPKDIAGKEVTLHGKAFIEEISVEDQKHYAEDGGATKEEIDRITAPKATYSFVADGVRLTN